MDPKKNIAKSIPPEYGFITRGVAAFFRFLQKISISQLFISNRVDAFNRSNFLLLTEDERKKATIHRARRVDLFICGCIALEILGVVIGSTSFGHVTIIRWFLEIVVVLRLIDILQVNINLSLFDVLRTGKDYHYMASVVRSIINVMINYFEIILCYGILYGYCEAHLDKTRDWMDAFYFSAITQVTVGFGEMMPRGALRWVTVSQFLLGYFFTALIIGRFISLLPQSRTIAGDGQSDES
jgi:hypothetical protein